MNVFICLGHERDDVVAVRKELVTYLHTNKSNYFTFSEDDKCSFIQPFRLENVSFKKTKLVSHDESTFRSGDVSKFKWMYPGKEPLYSKGRQRSLMASEFILLHPSGPFFELSDRRRIQHSMQKSQWTVERRLWASIFQKRCLWVYRAWWTKLFWQWNDPIPIRTNVSDAQI